MVEALTSDAAEMLSLTPSDAAEFCPGYAEAGTDERAAFWVACFSGLVHFESGWRPEASGAGGRYRGLLQISPTTARLLSAPCPASFGAGLVGS